MKNAYTILVINPEGKRPHGELSLERGWIINMDLRETGVGGMDWICLAWDIHL